MSEHGKLTKAQIERLLKPVREDRIEKKQGLSYVPQQEIRAELVRIFGPGNVDHTMHEPQLLWEEQEQKENGKVYYRAAYMVGCTLRIRDYEGNPVAEFTEYHVEQNANQPDRGEAHALAVTSAQSYALRRAAISLGDALGLHLYAGGSTAPLIRGTLQLTDPDSPMGPEKDDKPVDKSVDNSATATSPDARVSRLQNVTNVRETPDAG